MITTSQCCLSRFSNADKAMARRRICLSIPSGPISPSWFVFEADPNLRLTGSVRKMQSRSMFIIVGGFWVSMDGRECNFAEHKFGIYSGEVEMCRNWYKVCPRGGEGYYAGQCEGRGRRF